MRGPDVPSEQQEARLAQPEPVSLGAHTPKSHSLPKTLHPGQEEDDYEVEEIDDLVMADAH
jgi:hypothetical protein